MRRKFKEAEHAANVLFEGNAHQKVPTGKKDEGNLSIYARAFFEYFQYLDKRTSSLNTQRVNWMRNVRVNRSLIGQQPFLSPTNVDETTLNPTTAPHWRERDVVVKLLGRSQLMKYLSPLVSQLLRIDPLDLTNCHIEGLQMMIEVALVKTIMFFYLHLYYHLQERFVL